MSSGGRHGHKIRELKRRIDAVLEEEWASREPPPPPISAAHAALRKWIIEECNAIVPDYYVQDGRGLQLCTPESARHAVEPLGLMFKERELLARHGVDWRLHQNHYVE